MTDDLSVTIAVQHADTVVGVTVTDGDTDSMARALVGVLIAVGYMPNTVKNIGEAMMEQVS